MQHTDIDQLVLLEIKMDKNVIILLLDVLQSVRKWEAIYLEFSEGDLARALGAVLTLSNVCKVEIASNLTPSCIEALSSALSKNFSLVELELLVRLNQENLGVLISCLENSRGLRKLKLIKSTLETGLTGPLANFLQTCDIFKAIHVDRCILADNNIATLVDALEDHLTLRELYIGADLCETSLQCALSTIACNWLRHLSLRSSKQPSHDVSLDIAWMVPALQATASEGAGDVGKLFR